MFFLSPVRVFSFRAASTRQLRSSTTPKIETVCHAWKSTFSTILLGLCLPKADVYMIWGPEALKLFLSKQGLIAITKKSQCLNMNVAADRQEEEITALKSIYDDDFMEGPPPKAWKVRMFSFS
jgi:hypothetical protein